MAITVRNANAFVADVGRQVLEMKGYTKRVWQMALIRFAEYMNMPVDRGGNMPVRTGFLRSTLMASTSPLAIASLERPDADGPYPYFPTKVERIIMGARVGEKIYLGYLADYVWYAEYGGRNYAGHAFIRLAVQQWPSMVEWAKNAARTA